MYFICRLLFWLLNLKEIFAETESSGCRTLLRDRTSSSKDNCICERIQIVAHKCRCSGPQIVDVPYNLSTHLLVLVIEDADCMEVLKRDSLMPYSSTLQDLTLVNLENFYYFESGVFEHLRALQAVYIHRAPKLLKIQPDVFKAYLPRLKILRIVNTGLEEMPNLNDLMTDFVLHMIDLEHNNIQTIQTRQVSNIKVDHMLLNFNNLQTIEESAFFGSEIANLSLNGNYRLRNLHRRAFHGLSLRYIDLSSTAITFLPTDGLADIETLIVQRTITLKTIPSVFNFRSLKEAWLTYPYHCCAFKFPRTHDPVEYARFVKQMQQNCTSLNISIFKAATEIESDDDDGEQWGEANEFVHNISSTRLHVCGKIARNLDEVRCHPEPDAFNPCEDLMGNWALRLPVWLVALSALTGNVLVLAVIASSRFRLTVSKFLMCNLAAADLCIGLHLLLVAAADAASVGAYFNTAIDWQEGNGCRIAGSLTVFGNILSVYTLAIITTERWYTITWAIHLNKRLKLRTAVRVMLAGWCCAIIMAALPLMGVSSYSKTSICLPFEMKDNLDAIYLSLLLAFNAVAFALICVCYGSMYKSIREGGTMSSSTCVRSDLTVAKRMALLVFTDFACWAPIAFFGLTALLGYPMITVTQTKILLVFFYPLNSCANPCLYALLTQQYRRDFFILMGRYGLCKDRAERHKGAIGGKPLPYGAGAQYKRTCSDGLRKVGTGSSNLRGSSMTTVVSVECPMMMMSTNSRNSSKYRPEPILSMSELSNMRLNSFHESSRLATTENL